MKFNWAQKNVTFFLAVKRGTVSSSKRNVSFLCSQKSEIFVEPRSSLLDGVRPCAERNEKQICWQRIEKWDKNMRNIYTEVLVLLYKQGGIMVTKKKQTEDTELDYEDNSDQLAKILESATPLIQAIAPLLKTNQEKQAPIIKRSQWMNFVIMMTLCISISVLAYFKIIDGSAATGLIGAIIGYVFGHIYSNKERK
jgi:hypothetical protein